MSKILFGSLSYDSQEEYLKFIQEMDQAKAVAMLVAATAYAQSKGIYSMEESEVLINGIRKIVPASVMAEIVMPETPKSTEPESTN